MKSPNIVHATCSHKSVAANLLSDIKYSDKQNTIDWNARIIQQMKSPNIVHDTCSHKSVAANLLSDIKYSVDSQKA